MKTLLKVLFISLFSMTIQTGCSSGGNEDIPEPTPPAKENDYLNLSVSTHNITAEGGTINLSFATNTAWTASSDQSWCSLSPVSGDKNNAKTVVTVKENTDYSARTATITFKAGTAVKTVTIKQTARETDKITISNTSFKVNADGGTVNLAFTTNAAWTASCSQDWCTLSADAGEKGSQNLEATLSANPEETDRTATITIKAGTATENITILQYRDESIVTEKSVYEIGIEGGKLQVNVTSNTEYKVTVFAEWVTISENENGVLTLEVEKNNTEKTRETTIKLSGEYISTSFTVRQVHKSTGSSGVNGMPNTDWNS